MSGKEHPHPGPEWVKSSLSFSNGNCVEVTWRSATACGGDGCVEVGQGPGTILVRDSKHPDGAILGFTQEEWRAFLGGVRNGEFDRYAGD